MIGWRAEEINGTEYERRARERIEPKRNGETIEMERAARRVAGDSLLRAKGAKGRGTWEGNEATGRQTNGAMGKGAYEEKDYGRRECSRVRRQGNRGRGKGRGRARGRAGSKGKSERAKEERRMDRGRRGWRTRKGARGGEAGRITAERG